MTARIFRPAKTAMQSGRSKTRHWILEYTPSSQPSREPLMGWVSSGDTLQQVRMSFLTLEAAEDFAKSRSLNYRIIRPKERAARMISYADNFQFERKIPWTH